MLQNNSSYVFQREIVCEGILTAAICRYPRLTSPSSPPAHSVSSKEMSENSGQPQLLVKARFNFQQTNEDELTFAKGDIIGVTRQEDGGWWEGTLNGRTGWFPSNYVRELKGSGRWSVQPPATARW